MIVGSLGAIGMGIIQPLFFVFMATFFNGNSTNSTVDDFYNNAVTMTYYLIIFGTSFAFCGWLSVMCWVIVGARQGSIFRQKFFCSIISSDPGWLDGKTIAEIPGAIASDTLKIERAAGDKLVIIIFTTSMVVASMIIALIEGTQLTLAILAFGPIVVGGLYVLQKGTEQAAKASDVSYRKAGGIAEEALQEIRTVASLNGQDYETNK